MEDEKLLENSEYTIYKAKNYCAVIPNNPTGPINILVDLHQGNLINGENETIVNATIEEYNKLKGTISNGLLILTQINEEAYSNALKEGNYSEEAMLNIAKTIGTITKELDKKVANIKHEITIVERNNDDKKYVENIPQSIAAIFKGLPFKEEQKELAPSTIEEPPKEENPIASADIFGSASAETPAVQETPIPVTETPKKDPSKQVVDNNTFQFPTSSESAPEPKPLGNVELLHTTGETTDIPTIQGQAQGSNELLQGSNELLQGNKTLLQGQRHALVKQRKRGGFANLAILLIVLVVVTIISIEFGKYLYSVYGA